MPGGFVVAAQQGRHPVAGVEFQPDGGHLLGADQQHLPPVQREKVGALPHPAVLVAAGVQGGGVMPVGAVGALEQADGAAAVLGAVARHHVKGPVLLPDLGVPEVQHAAPCGQVAAVQNGVAGVLFIVDPVAKSKALLLELFHPAVRTAHPVNAGVHQHLPAVRQFQRAAGKAAVPVRGGVGGDGHRQLLPPDKVAGLDVAPVHRAPVGGIGVVLVEQMILPFVAGKTVGIVDPADGRRHVEGGPLGRGDMGGVLRLKVARFLQGIADHGGTS